MKAVVLFTAVGWYEDGVRREADQGETVELPKEEFERLAAFGAVTAAGKTGGVEPAGDGS